MTWRRRRVLGASVALLGLAGCAQGTVDSTPTATSTDGETSASGASTEATAPADSPPEATYAYTSVHASGNRYLAAASGGIDGVDPVELPVPGTPAWLLGFRADAASQWIVVQADGSAETYRVADGRYEHLESLGGVDIPPLGFVTGRTPSTVDRPAHCADRSHPLPVDNAWLCVDSDGALAHTGPDETIRRTIDAPTDVRIVRLDESRYVCYSDRTDRYGHGALGDTTEPSGFVVFDTNTGTLETRLSLAAPLVFEGLSPLVADLDGDGDPEIVTTVADSQDGARIRVYRPDGTEIATGSIYGSGWRHQLAVAPFAPDGTPELAVVRKPHVNHTLEFYRLTGDDLEIVATHQGYSSHTYGSRNLDGGVAGDFDGDGRVELLVPRIDRQTLDAVRRTPDGATTAWSLSLGGTLTTNLTGVRLASGSVAVGAGTADGVRVWQG